MHLTSIETEGLILTTSFGCIRKSENRSGDPTAAPFEAVASPVSSSGDAGHSRLIREAEIYAGI
jgi:hypothetical protein